MTEALNPEDFVIEATYDGELSLDCELCPSARSWWQKPFFNGATLAELIGYAQEHVTERHAAK